jgi:hypothetical protein
VHQLEPAGVVESITMRLVGLGTSSAALTRRDLEQSSVSTRGGCQASVGGENLGVDVLGDAEMPVLLESAARAPRLLR